MEAPPQRLSGFIDRFGVRREPLPPFPQRLPVQLVHPGRREWHRLERGGQRGRHLAAPGPLPVQVEQVVAEPGGGQPVLDHVERGRRLGDEQHPLPGVGQGADHVRHGLRLAGPGRAVDHEAVPGQRGGDALPLVRVGVQQQRHVVVQLARLEPETAVLGGQRADHRMPEDHRLVLGQILPDRLSGQVEDGQHDRVGEPPAGLLRDPRTQLGVVRGELDAELGHPAGEGRVEQRVTGAGAQPGHVAGPERDQVDRREQHRAGVRRAGRVLPVQQPGRQVQDVLAAFHALLVGVPAQVPQQGLQGIRRQLGPHRVATGPERPVPAGAQALQNGVRAGAGDLDEVGPGSRQVDEPVGGGGVADPVTPGGEGRASVVARPALSFCIFRPHLPIAARQPIPCWRFVRKTPAFAPYRRRRATSTVSLTTPS